MRAKMNNVQIVSPEKRWDVKPLRCPYLVGCHNVLGWSNNKMWQPIKKLRPYLGQYNQDLSEVADWHIKWACEHGISYFLFLFQWAHGKTFEESAHFVRPGESLETYKAQVDGREQHIAMIQAFLQSSNNKYMKFAIHFVNEVYFHLKSTERTAKYFDWGVEWDLECPRDFEHDFSRQDFLNFFTYLADNYFSIPQYLKVQGKYPVTIYRSQLLIKALGIKGLRAIYDECREMLKKRGFEIFLIAGGSCIHDDYPPAAAEAGYDALSGYNYPWAVGTEMGLTPRGKRKMVGSYGEAVAKYEELWQRLREKCREAEISYLPPMMSGFDNSDWSGTVILEGATPSLFEKMCRNVVKYVDPNYPLIELDAWNEWGEGSVVEPCHEWGFDYLEALRQGLVGDKERHIDYIPEEIKHLQVVQ